MQMEARQGQGPCHGDSEPSLLIQQISLQKISHENMKRRKIDFYLCWNIVVVTLLAVFFYYFISSVM